MFCKLLESKVFGQIVVMRDFDDEQEKVKVMFAYGGAVQEIKMCFETEKGADDAFKLVDLTTAEGALNPFLQMGMVD